MKRHVSYLLFALQFIKKEGIIIVKIVGDGRDSGETRHHVLRESDEPGDRGMDGAYAVTVPAVHQDINII